MELVIMNIFTATCFGLAAGRASKDSVVGLLVGFGALLFLALLHVLARTHGAML